jgi:hypothetical protein
MNKIIVEAKDSLYDILKLVQNTKDEVINITFNKGVQFYQNSSNLDVIKKIAEQHGIKTKFDVENLTHKDYIESINNNVTETQETSVNIETAKNQKIHKKKNSINDRLLTFPLLPKFKKLSGFNPQSSSVINNKLKKVIVLVITLFGIMGLFGFLIWLMPSAQVAVAVDSEVLVKLLEVKATTEVEEISSETSSIPALVIEVTEEDSLTNKTTGEKETGEYATGEITIINKTDKSIEIKKGTEIKLIRTEGESLKYETMDKREVDKSDTITSSSDEGEKTETVYKKEKVKIKAKAYGDKYNINDGEKFEINGYDTDEVIGENDKDINGGKLDKVMIVTKDDMDKLKSTMDENLKDNVKRALARKIVTGQILNEASSKYEIQSETYSKKADEEAEELTITTKMKGSTLVYLKDDLDDLVKDMVKKVVPAEYSLNTDNPEYETAVVSVSEDGKSIVLQIKLRSYITPKIDKETIKQELAGRTTEEASDYLNNYNALSSYEIKLSPKLPGFLRRMPYRTENISIEIKQ